MARLRTLALGAGISLLGLAAGAADASDTTTYTYDANGRLIAITRAGGPNDGVQTTTTFDPASNRTNYAVAGGTLSVALSIGNASATEGGNLVFTVTRSGNAASAISVNYATANGTAVAGSDYNATSGTLNFAAGQTTATITVPTIDDSVYESTETMTVTLSAPTGGATLGIATATGTILDNDPAPSTLSIGNASATEGGSLAFPVTRTGATSTAVTAHYVTANGSAVAGSDYTASSGTVSLAAGQTTATITVPTIDDAIPEGTETMTVGLSSPTGGATIGTATGTGTITDNDPNATLAIGNASATEGQNLVFTVTRTGNTGFAESVNYATADGTATAGSDYTATSGTLSFAAGQTTATITVPTIDDTVVEPTETLTVTLSGASFGTTIATATGTGSIIDNDIPPPVAVGDSISFKCLSTPSLNLVANDYDPNGHTPITLVSIQANSGGASAHVINSTSAQFSSHADGSFSFTYTIKNSLGATANGTVLVTVTSPPNCAN